MKIANFDTLETKRSFDIMSSNLLGTVVKTSKELNTNGYGVYINRLMPGIDISAGASETVIPLVSTKCLNSKNKIIGDTSVAITNYIVLNSDVLYNIGTPSFVKGERINIEMVDQDIKSMVIRPYGVDDIRKRPFDTFKAYVPATGTTEKIALDDSNCYYLLLDSENKQIKLHMSDKNGEVSEYDLVMDGENGVLSLSDGGRSVAFGTDDDIINVKTKDGAIVTLKRKDINMEGDNLNIKMKSSINIETENFKGKLTNMKIEGDKLTGDIDNVALKGTSYKSEYNKVEMTGKKIVQNFDIAIIDGKVCTVTGQLVPGGIGFGAPAGQPAPPTAPMISKQGMANFAGPSGLPLTKFTPLFTFLNATAIKVDAVGGLIGLPPTSVSMLQSLSSQMMSPVSKG